MKNIKEEKENLLKQLRDLNEKESEQRIQLHYPKFKEMEGTFYKVKNSYSNSKNWWQYIKIQTIKPEDLYEIHEGKIVTATYRGVSFQTCSYGVTSFDTKHENCTYLLEEQITEAEFKKAYNKAIKAVNKALEL